MIFEVPRISSVCREEGREELTTARRSNDSKQAAKLSSYPICLSVSRVLILASINSTNISCFSVSQLISSLPSLCRSTKISILRPPTSLRTCAILIILPREIGIRLVSKHMLHQSRNSLQILRPLKHLVYRYLHLRPPLSLQCICTRAVNTLFKSCPSNHCCTLRSNISQTPKQGKADRTRNQESLKNSP